MDRSMPRPGDDGEVLLAGGSEARVARHMARERQKHELRRERDRLVLDLARDLGSDGVAERLGVSRAAMAKLLESARARLGATEAAGGPGGIEISARRLRPGEGRWADADAHYEALGRGPGGR